MTDQQHPITPPPELVCQWRDKWLDDECTDFSMLIATQAARWGADQELEAILELAGEPSLPERDRYFDGFTVASIREERRPKQPSLKELALDTLSLMLMFIPLGAQREQGEIIRRALEALPE